MTKEEKVNATIRAERDFGERMKTHFLHYFEKNGKFELEKVKNYLSEKQVVFSSESYGLEWLGKLYERFLASATATTLLKANDSNRKQIDIDFYYYILKMLKENQHIKLKRQFDENIEIEKKVVAFLNSREGGKIYIGIDNSGFIVGMQNIDKAMLQTKDRKKNIAPSVLGLIDVVEEEIDKGKIIKIIVASGSEIPHYIRKYGMTPKGCYIRNGTAA